MAEPFRRITGTEMEYIFSIDVKHGPPGHEPYLESGEYEPYVNQLLEEAKIPYLRTASKKQSMHWLGNGSRWYTDTGQHREYATPEDDSLLGTTANEMVGEALTAGVARLMEAVEPNPFGPIEVNKRVIDDTGMVCGYHENYCVDANAISIDADSLALLGVHMATRNILFGAGHLKRDGKFELSQKGSRPTCEFSSGTTGASKPVVNLRDQPECDGEVNRRVHMISGDPTMSPWATTLKLGTTSLVLALIEHGRPLPNLRLKDSLVKVMQTVSQDLDGKNRYRLQNGRAKSAAEIQLTMLRAAKGLARQVDFDDDHLWSLQEWEKGLRDFIQDPQLLRNRADWVLKQEIISRVHDKHGLNWQDPKLRGIERRFSVLDATSYGLDFRQSSWQQWMPSETLLKERLAMDPPQTTRAVLRGTYISKFPDSGGSVNWPSIIHKGSTYQINRPFMTTHAELQELFDSTGVQIQESSTDDDSYKDQYYEFTD